jgi:2-C-methyl-D-erythritol 2,4-cyclodiphosphate synthase
MDQLQRTLSARRLVVKVGSSLLVEPSGQVRAAWLDGLAKDVARLRARGQQVAIVTSGAIALGRATLRMPQRPLRLEEKQAAAATGQILLARAWQRVRDDGWELVNADVILIGEEPRLAPHRNAMRERLAEVLGVEVERVAVRATTTDGLGFTGRREGLAAQAVALLRR